MEFLSSNKGCVKHKARVLCLISNLFLISTVFAAGGSCLQEKVPQYFDVVVLGAGPAGLSAIMHLADAHVSSVSLTGPELGGLLTHAAKVENIPFVLPESGLSIMQRLIEQAQAHGAQFVYDSATRVDLTQFPFIIETADSGVFSTKSLLIALGSSPRKLHVPGEETYWGHGVSGCALCDAFAYENREVVVVGGGDSAVDQAIHLANYASKVTVFVRGREMRAKQSRMRELLKKVNVVYNKKVLEIVGDGQQVTGIKIQDRVSGVEEIFPTNGVFLAIGHEPNTWLFKNSLALSSDGHIPVDFESMQTSVPGVFAVGDIVDGSYRQVPVAVGDAIKAAGKIINFVRYRED